MYSYEWDKETGGLLLNSTPLNFSKEPRPVYSQELDLLGFNKYWNYTQNEDSPYMWAESNNFWYKGKLVAKIKGGSLYTPPEIILIEAPEVGKAPLSCIDISRMTEKNKELLEQLKQDTIKKIYNTFVEYERKVDVFYVAFSGGKDSVVALDLVQKALPHNKFKVLFGDTGMEFPDTYTTIKKVQEELSEKGIEFIKAQSHFTPSDSWKIFGAPATVSRWCCSVHKTAPQILALRTIMNKTKVTGLAFIGVRADESLSRSQYDYISIGEKHKGQYSCNPILEWNSAELYLYTYAEKLLLNEAYKKGNRRVGCLICPGATERSEYVTRSCYTKEFDSLMTLIKEQYSENFSSTEKLDEFIQNGGWKARKNGRDINIDINYSETTVKNYHCISIANPKTNWKVWIRTIGRLLNDESPYKILFRNQQYEFIIEETAESILVKYESALSKENPLFTKLLKNIFRKTATCALCRECEVDCHNGCLHMAEDHFSISENCTSCAQCHKVEKGCLVYKSLEKPKGDLKMSATKSLNCYSHHAPKIDWINQYFNLKNNFDSQHTLGSQMYSFFKRFLRDSKLLDETGFSHTAQIIEKQGLDNNSSWALLLVNLAYTPQVNWLLKRIPMNEVHTRDYTISLLLDDGAKESWVGDIWSSISRLVDLPFSQVGLGVGNRERNRMVSLIRTKWETPDPIIVLYSLYKFAESCGDYYQFTLSRLLNHEIISDGISPSEIFGIERNQMEKILNGLSVNYPEFINASFTLDLDNITLDGTKSSHDVLELL